MAGGKQNAAAMKAAKQKKIAIGGAVLLIGIMVIQGPKMLKLLSGGSTPAAAAAPAGAPVPVAPPPGAAPATPAATAPSGTKLVSFERFSSKDPFSAQIVAPTTSSNNDDTSQGASATPTASATASGTGVAVVPKASSSSSSDVTANVKKVPAPQQLVIASGGTTAIIKVNGTSENLSKGDDFPKSDPTFSLVSFGSGGTSVTIGIAGGSLKVGGKTFVLNTGETKTLLNTADSKRYTVTLVSVQGSSG